MNSLHQSPLGIEFATLVTTFSCTNDFPKKSQSKSNYYYQNAAKIIQTKRIYTENV